MINILLPYENSAEYFEFWANDEENIDFRKNIDEACRCTVAFAATELIHYLALLGFEAKVTDNASESAERTIKLLCGDDIHGECFTVTDENGITTIDGSGRIGVLYGVYELLEAQGIRWYSPTEEFVPTDVTELKIPTGEHKPSMPLGRGFVFEGPLKESRRLYLWMARNKLNLSTLRYNTPAYQRKLGMIFKMPGHIFEHVIDPKKRTESGKTFFEAHSDWYGKTDVELTPENALRRQFCVTNDELLEYLWQNLKHRMQNEWYEVDRMDLAGFDTWGKICQCEKCKKLGNGSDQMLYFISYLRKRLDESIADGSLDHNVRFVLCSYEGTATIEPPINPVPENLRTSGDYVVFFPILRCYEHTLSDPNCSHNINYRKYLENWRDIPVMVGEYYNVSRYEELPLVFWSTMPGDISSYAKLGVTGMTYMHLPMLDWGIKTLTQFLYAKLCWNAYAEAEPIIDKYLDDLYGEFADKAKSVYTLCAESGKNIASWRNWNNKSIYNGLSGWNGKPAANDIYRDDHLGADTVKLGKSSISLYERALDILTELRPKADELYMKQFKLVNGVAVNPNDARFRLRKNALGERISSDVRGVKYAIDMYKLMSGFVEYFEALREGRDTDELWANLRRLCLDTEAYCYGVRFDHPLADIRHVDVLERSGLKDLYYKCMAARIAMGLTV